jgi:aldehyde dehydrogenase (NAD+)
MRDYRKFYIDGAWVDPAGSRTLDVINPATEQVAGVIAVGTAEDVDLAVKAARRAFASWSRSSRGERIELMRNILAEYQKRTNDLAEAVTEEMGAPAWLAAQAHVVLGSGHIKTAIELLGTYEFSSDRGPTRILREPIGVCALITPWNWPINQIACKVAPALAVGCTMVLKPSEVAPFSGQIWSEVMAAAGVPAGVYNMIHGGGDPVGQAMSSHPQVDMVSFTGSTRAGIDIARRAAPTVKRVSQELGGKSPNLVLDDADFAKAVADGVQSIMRNSGQTCTAPTRMLVPAGRMREAAEIAKATAESINVGDPNGNAMVGPVVSEVQWDKIQGLIQVGIDEGATLVTGGPGRPEGLERGYYVRPTVFADVNNDMRIAREEIFGPVLAILGFDNEAQAIEIANDTDYGLAAYVQTTNHDHGLDVAAQLRAGQVRLNEAGLDLRAPFGGYKQSGNGREWGEYGFDEFTEVKAVLGGAKPAVAAE